ncbi:MAG: PAS domain-containing protein [Sandaracinaceae bacterium]|nr:PAS domain-containing protein [Sandaracinaceae bacterium]
MSQEERAGGARDALLATLVAYRKVQRASWPQLNTTQGHDESWSSMSTKALEAELERLVAETQRSGQEVRVFWKLGTDFVYAGCNDQFARDAGFRQAKDLIGKTDFDPDISWLRQSAKYRRDDTEVVQTGSEKLDIIERQDSPSGTIWLRTGKAPIRPAGKRAIGILGMYEVIDSATAAKLSRKRS